MIHTDTSYESTDSQGDIEFVSETESPGMRTHDSPMLPSNEVMLERPSRNQGGLPGAGYTNSSQDESAEDMEEESPEASKKKRLLFRKLNTKEVFGLTPKELSVKYSVSEDVLLYLLPACEATEMLEEILGYGEGREPSKLVNAKWRSKKQ